MIAILGATGLIGGALARLLAGAGQPLALFARDTRKLAAMGWPSSVSLNELDAFRADAFDLVVNAVGAGDPGRVRALGADIIDISDHWDRRVLETLGATTHYVFLSSGAIYGACTSAPDGEAMLALPVNRLETVPPYTLAKLIAEARHRSRGERAILDLRIFAFADAAIDRAGHFFLAELARSVADGTPFETAPSDFLRDYVGAQDLWQLIQCWQGAGAPNCALDAYSLKPVSKSDLLAAVRERFGTSIRVSARDESPTGAKPVYASAFRAAEALGYRARTSSMEHVMAVLDAIVAARLQAVPMKASGARR